MNAIFLPVSYDPLVYFGWPGFAVNGVNETLGLMIESVKVPNEDEIGAQPGIVPHNEPHGGVLRCPTNAVGLIGFARRSTGLGDFSGNFGFDQRF